MTRMSTGTDYLTDWARDHDIDLGQLTRLFDGLSDVGRDSRGAQPLQEPELLFPGLRTAPWHDPADHPWVKVLEEAFPAIKAEFQKEHAGLGTHPESGELALAGSWRTYYFYNLGQQNDDHLAACPETARALAEIPGIDSAGMCYFSVMAPGTRVKPHCGFANIRIRCHLGLVVPDDCWMRVGAESRTWTEGRCMVFDDSFEHEVANGDKGPRAVLLLDTWHPDLTSVERAALRHLMTQWSEELD